VPCGELKKQGGLLKFGLDLADFWDYAIPMLFFLFFCQPKTIIVISN
jgi:hypothetical protein